MSCRNSFVTDDFSEDEIFTDDDDDDEENQRKSDGAGHLYDPPSVPKLSSTTSLSSPSSPLRNSAPAQEGEVGNVADIQWETESIASSAAEMDEDRTLWDNEAELHRVSGVDMSDMGEEEEYVIFDEESCIDSDSDGERDTISHLDDDEKDGDSLCHRSPSPSLRKRKASESSFDGERECGRLRGGELSSPQYSNVMNTVSSPSTASFASNAGFSSLPTNHCTPHDKYADSNNQHDYCRLNREDHSVPNTDYSNMSSLSSSTGKTASFVVGGSPFHASSSSLHRSTPLRRLSSPLSSSVTSPSLSQSSEGKLLATPI